MAKIYLSIGTNVGDRKANLVQAVSRLAPEIFPNLISPVYETKPVGLAEQPDFYNIALAGDTALAPYDVLAHLKRIEADMGREKTVANGPRVIDLDLLYYDDLAYESEELAIPHPRRVGRAFVYAPLADIAPDFVDPVTGKTVLAMLEDIEDRERQVTRL